MKKITKQTLTKWDACRSGFDRFNELFPKGAYLRQASDGLIADNHPDWSNWLWSKCKQDPDFVEQCTATAGNFGTATAGDEGTATAGYKGTATAGNFGTATAGDEGTATAGNLGTATAGNLGTATAGNLGTATAGDEGVIILTYYDASKQRYVRKFGLIASDGLKPNVLYKLNNAGNFVEVPKHQIKQEGNTTNV